MPYARPAAGAAPSREAADPPPAPGKGDPGDDPYTATALDAPWTADPAGGTGPREGIGGTPGTRVPAPRRTPGRGTGADTVLHTTAATTAATVPDVPAATGAGTGSAERSGAAEGPGEVLRFGPGVPYRRSGGTSGSGPTAVLPLPATVPDPASGASTPGGVRPGVSRSRARRALRYLPAVLVLVAACGWVWWQRFGPDLAVREVTVHSPGGAPTCDGTAEILGVLRTNGRPGEVRYEWLRSDGTTSGELVERVPRGREEVRLRLLWTFRGEGVVTASARLRLIDPPLGDVEGREAGPARVDLTYSCP
ncbi:hypothetical protein [Streptomyces calidiresistens]|uniref:Uncharacterized protein n=1 Tax=Streptomyces calidiresistens TaxID=1485586 RepID=A0A7W3XXZ2_9ACTN|nr:hypothetical protein [Streptomyces calidiresistens]MBB0231474.1 hypothetical protein [Streptomyces calidiresistens]